MRILLLSFSGTGHTASYAKAIQERFVEKGHEVVSYIFRHDQPFNEDIESFDMIGIGYPIHAFNVPQTFNNFLKALPKANKPYFIFKVSGEPYHFNDASSYHFAKKLKKKGYELIAEKHFLMPYNIIFRYPDALAKQMYLYQKPLSELFVQNILEGKGERIPYRFGKKVLSFFFRIEWIAPKINAPLMRAKKKRCTGCLLCLKQCPTGAIYQKKNGKLRFKASRCAMCMKCAMNCPHDAIGFGILNPWKVNGPFAFEKIVNDPEIDPHFVHEGMKGYFRHFVPYFKKQDELLKQNNIENPLD